MNKPKERPEWFTEPEHHTFQAFLMFCFFLIVVVPIFMVIDVVLWIRDKLRRED